jgi:hypothetical protein
VLLDPRSTAAPGLLAAVLSVAACGRHAEQERHLIPGGYAGEVFIVFGAQDGAAPEYDQAARVYRIPPTGILRTQAPPNEGWYGPGEVRYFFVESRTGHRAEIADRWTSTIHDTPENRADPSVGVFGPRSGAVAARVPGTDTFSSEAPCAVRYLSYRVGRKVAVLEARDDGRLHDYLERHPLPCV